MAAPVETGRLPLAGLQDPPAPAAAEPVIAARGLAKSYRGAVALDHVDLDVQRGEFLTLLGPSGSGKTTLLGLIAGIILPTAGRIALAGRDISRVPPEHRDIGVVFQNYALFPHLSVRDNIAFPLRMRRVPRAGRDAKVAAALELVRLGDLAGRRPAELSGGQQQRVALARALVFDPAILLMDEPLSALDKKLRDHMKAELRQIQQALGLTIVYVTHDQGEALALSSRIALMNGGRILQIGTPQEIYERPRSRFVADFVGEANLFSAPVLGTEADRLVLRLGEQTMRVALRPHEPVPLARRSALVLVRPEHVAIGAAARALENRFTGRVVSSLYEGAARLVTVELGGELVRARAAGRHDGPDPRPGETIEIGWSAADPHVVELDAR
ncbi:ABC transporter ATP-binding protein [Labrys wisconsinensis]|uniref:Spermidine/putrescine import ATP-binding protein PotA n=1 Tax=Labrys wisconsinensis TaxID=425677 RepID=A0ABU0JC19_9HYPH|nr:ABC transporter ATP-binding protein [Labrys wisconsinensis]MDQ0471835.1 spermidine/putrescine ABC transporter ATP-binding subunit [Labrys wisconsinensis]